MGQHDLALGILDSGLRHPMVKKKLLEVFELIAGTTRLSQNRIASARKQSAFSCRRQKSISCRQFCIRNAAVEQLSRCV